MCVAPMSLDAAKRMFANSLSSFVILWILFDVVIVNVNSILVFAALNNAFGQFSALVF